MTVRKWSAWLKFSLWFVAGLLTLILLLVLFGKSLAITYLSPSEHFESTQSPLPPDYNNDYFWMAHPDIADSSDLIPALVPSLTWAQCQPDGRLEIAEQHNNAFSNHLDNADQSYHILDFSLFYGNIRDNAKLRTQVYLSHYNLNNRSN